jgi:hypothetical protein
MKFVSTRVPVAGERLRASFSHTLRDLIDVLLYRKVHSDQSAMCVVTCLVWCTVAERTKSMLTLISRRRSLFIISFTFYTVRLAVRFSAFYRRLYENDACSFDDRVTSTRWAVWATPLTVQRFNACILGFL